MSSASHEDSKRRGQTEDEIMRLHHHALIVGDMDRSIEIYCSLLGMRLLRRKAGVAYEEVAMLGDVQEECRLELLLQRGAVSHLDHIAFEVEDVDREFHRLKAEGFTVEREPFDVPGGTRTIRTSFLRAPDGVKIELIHYGAAMDPNVSLAHRAG